MAVPGIEAYSDHVAGSLGFYSGNKLLGYISCNFPHPTGKMWEVWEHCSQLRNIISFLSYASKSPVAGCLIVVLLDWGSVLVMHHLMPMAQP